MIDLFAASRATAMDGRRRHHCCIRASHGISPCSENARPRMGLMFPAHTREDLSCLLGGLADRRQTFRLFPLRRTHILKALRARIARRRRCFGASSSLDVGIVETCVVRHVDCVVWSLDIIWLCLSSRGIVADAESGQRSQEEMTGMRRQCTGAQCRSK
jgi:hypothetical protein